MGNFVSCNSAKKKTFIDIIYSYDMSKIKGNYMQTFEI